MPLSCWAPRSTGDVRPRCCAPGSTTRWRSGGVIGRCAWCSQEAVARAIDRQVLALYHVQPTNLCAYRMAEGGLPPDLAHLAGTADSVEREFRMRLDALPEAERPFMIAMYANPLRNRAALA